MFGNDKSTQKESSMKNKNTILSIIKLTMLYVLGFISLVTVSKFYVFLLMFLIKMGLVGQH